MPLRRPTEAVCAHCGKPFTVNPVGRIARFCRPACRVMAFDKKHGRPKAPIEDRIAGRIWQAMVDAGLVTGELPPKREVEDAA